VRKFGEESQSVMSVAEFILMAKEQIKSKS
jgi:hypothetical protein